MARHLDLWLMAYGYGMLRALRTARWLYHNKKPGRNLKEANRRCLVNSERDMQDESKTELELVFLESFGHHVCVCDRSGPQSISMHA
eukprot:scaffold146427_cov33-Tisochrysis_lutea.AAC.1